MTKVLFLLGALAVAGCLGMLCVRLERRGRPELVVMGIIILLVIESTLYYNQDDMPRSVFHPGTGTLDFRLYEVIISVALVAHMIVKGLPRRIGFPAMLWAAWAAWMTISAVEGFLRHNSLTWIDYEAKAIIYVAGGYALASRVPIRLYLERDFFGRLMRWSTFPAALLDLMTETHKVYALHIPLLPVPAFGLVGADTATIFVSIAVLGLALEMARDRRRWSSVVAALPLLATAVTSGQRAALLGLGGASAVLVVAVLGASARRRLRVTSAEVLTCVLAAVALTTVVTVVPAALAQHPATVPLQSSLEATFNSTAKVESAQDRLNQWDVARSLIEQQPIIGWGLGIEFIYYTPGPNQLVTTAVSHQILLDLWLRTGIIGLVLFLLALIVSLVEGLKIWRSHPDDLVAILAIALVALVVGLVTKGMVESIFEKYRLATMLGISLGILRSTVTSTGGTPSVFIGHREQEWV